MKTTYAAALAALAGLSIGVAHAQDRNFNVADGQWNVAGNWLEGAVPTAANNVYIEGGRRARIAAYAANANYLGIGYDTNGYLFQTAGLLTVATTTEVGGNTNAAPGIYEINGVGQLITNTLYIGRDADNSGMNFSGSMGMRVDQDAFVGGRKRGFFTQNNGVVQISRDLSMGNFAGGRGEWNVVGGNTSVFRDAYIGYNQTATAQLKVGTNGTFGINGNLFVGQFDAAVPLQGEVINTGNIVGANAGSRIVVQGSKSRVTGTGTYNIAVRYESDQVFGNSDKSVAVEFAKNTLTRSNRFNANAGLTARSGDVAARTALTNSSLPGTSVALSWGDADSSRSANYNSVVATPANWITVQSSFKPADVQAAVGIEAANLAGRVRLMQVGGRRFAANGTELANTTGQVMNITTSVDAATGTVIGKTPDLFGASDTTIVGRAVEVKDQNPAFNTLHNSGDYLTGTGVLMGQLEPGLPDFNFGCFEDFTKVNGVRASRNGAAGATDAHATRVASIMTGYDPFGVQVDQQGRVVTAANGYGAAGSAQRGFVGVAPYATLQSRAMTVGANSAADINALATASDPNAGAMKIINMSATTGSATKDGTTVLERAIDRQVEQNHIIFVKSAGNSGQAAGGPYGTLTNPAGAYNGIVVGNVAFDDTTGGRANVHPTNFDAAHATIRLSSSRGPTPDMRHGVDIVAQGVSNLAAFAYENTSAAGNPQYDPSYAVGASHGLYSTQDRRSDTSAPIGMSGTSFAAPTVAGTTALMVETARRVMQLPPAEEPNVIKSVLQTSADKPADWAKGRGTAAEQMNSQIPLSYTYGAGVLDPVGAINLLKQGLPDNTSNITHDGWYWTTSMNDDTTGQRGKLADGSIGVLTGDAYILKDVLPDTSLSMTLNWYSHVDDTNTRSALDNIFLQLYSKDANGVWEPVDGYLSDSRVDNLQHLWTQANAFTGGDILARVWSPNAIPAAIGSEVYALSWEFTGGVIPAPGVMALLGMVGVFAARRKRA
ncbi:MAG: S8 family serine peptidase [Phycisphaerales bacterium]|jgi:hypothetical protein